METISELTEEKIRTKVDEFIVENFLFGDDSRKPGSDDSLLNTGVIDSTGVLELIEFLEQSFGIEVKENETVPQNLDSIGNIVRYVRQKSLGST